MLIRFFRYCKTLICPADFIFDARDYRLLLDPLSLWLLLDRLEFSHSQTSRIENRVRLGSTVLLRNESTLDYLTLRLVNDRKTGLNMGVVSLTSPMGIALLGTRCGEVVVVNSLKGASKWQLEAVSHNSTKILK